MNFFDSLSNQELLFQNRVVNFISNDYPVLFFSLFLNKIKTKINVRVVDDFDSIVQESQMSFLGQRTVFWLGSLDAYQEKTKSKIIKYISEYKGENIICVFGSEKINNIQNIELPNIENKVSFIKLAKFILPNVGKTLEFNIENFFKYAAKFSLDQAILLTYYGSSIGVTSKQFFDEWFNKIIATEKSLFTLSNFLFARDKKFFEYWYKIKDEYQPAFWTTYWSELFFRAYWYTYYRKNNLLSDAKKISFRLPYNFINKDWKNYDETKLLQAQDDFYKLDISVKSGKFFLPDLLFMNFIINE